MLHGERGKEDRSTERLHVRKSAQRELRKGGKKKTNSVELL